MVANCLLGLFLIMFNILLLNKMPTVSIYNGNHHLTELRRTRDSGAACGVVLSWGASAGCSQTSARAAETSGRLAPVAGRGCWLRRGPRFLPAEWPLDMLLTPPGWRARKQKHGSHHVFYVLASEITRCHLHCVLLVTQVSRIQVGRIHMRVSTPGIILGTGCHMCSSLAGWY